MLAAVIAVVPFYGYVVHAARDGQTTALVIGVCWLVTCGMALGAVVRGLRRPVAPSRRRASWGWALGLALAAVVGWGGVRAAFYELIAG